MPVAPGPIDLIFAFEYGKGASAGILTGVDP